LKKENIKISKKKSFRNKDLWQELKRKFSEKNHKISVSKFEKSLERKCFENNSKYENV